MQIGKVVRKVLGKRYFPVLGRVYRLLFGDINRIFKCVTINKPDAVVLDIGGGDGDIINILLSRYPEIKVTIIDISATAGNFLRSEFKDKVKVISNTSISDYISMINEEPDYIMVNYVLHHIKISERMKFLNEIKSLINGKSTKIVITEVEPGYILSYLGYYSDRYISGDRDTKLIKQDELIGIMKSVFPIVTYEYTDVFKNNKPNYCLIFNVN